LPPPLNITNGHRL